MIRIAHTTQETISKELRNLSSILKQCPIVNQASAANKTEQIAFPLHRTHRTAPEQHGQNIEFVRTRRIQVGNDVTLNCNRTTYEHEA